MKKPKLDKSMKRWIIVMIAGLAALFTLDVCARSAA